MALSTYLLYVVAVAVLIVTPGPTMLMCMANAINRIGGGPFAPMGGLLLLTRRSA